MWGQHLPDVLPHLDPHASSSILTKWFTAIGFKLSYQQKGGRPVPNTFKAAIVDCEYAKYLKWFLTNLPWCHLISISVYRIKNYKNNQSIFLFSSYTRNFNKIH